MIEATRTAALLLAWGAVHWADRALPWRAPGEPLERRALVEGLLAQTRAEAVAAAYAAIFEGIFGAYDWERYSESTRMERVAPLGLPTLKRRAVDGIARALSWGGPGLPSEELLAILEGQPGIGPYTAGMVVLLCGGEAAPVDCNVARVGQRVAPGVDPAAWCAEVIAAARALPSPLPEFPAGYVAISAILDVGATRCRIGQAPQCAGCPLAGGCEYEARGPRQMEMLA